jgi:hypothetical protein
MIYNLINRSKASLSRLPTASHVLECYLRQESYPHWTSFYVKYKDVVNDQFSSTCFVTKLDDKETGTQRYFILRTGCFPFIKYHCSKIKPHEFIDKQQLEFQNKFFNVIKVLNLGKGD